MKRKIVIAGLAAALVMAVSAPVFADLPVAGSVGNVSAAAGAALGDVGCRIYSRHGADAGINSNLCATNASCCNTRCVIPGPTGTGYRTAAIFNGGGYNCPGENTASYNGDANGQPMYELIDGQMNAGACNHIAFYAIQGQITTSGAGPNNVGDGRTTGCSGTGSNCFQRADSSNASAPLEHTLATFGPTPNNIAAAGGLNPNPTAQVTRPGGGGCLATEVRVTWAAPNAGQMKNGLQSPVKGIHLWKSSNSCGSCPGGDVTAGGWSLADPAVLANGITGTCVPISGDTWFATTVVVDGPSSGATTLDTGIVGGQGFVGANSQCVQLVQTASRIVLVTARYAGRGTVSVSFRTGTEGGVQGYYVQRASSPTGPFARVSDVLTPQGDGSNYSFSDKVRASLGRTMYYQIQIVKTDGTTETSGASAVNLPAQKAKKIGENQ